MNLKIFIGVFALSLLLFAQSTIAATVMITPSQPTTSENLVCTYDGSSAIDHYEWYQNGARRYDINWDTVQSSATDIGDEWKCEVYAYVPLSSPVKVGESIVSIQNTLPTPFSLISPSDGTENAPSSGIVLKWQPSTDPDGYDVTYDVYFGTSPNPPKKWTVTGTSVSTGQLSYGTTYYWTVHALDPHGGRRKASSGVWRFTVEQPPNANPVAVLSAAPAAVVVGETVTLDGSGSYDPDGDGISSYKFYCGDGSNSGWITSSSYQCSYDTPGQYEASLVVKDARGGVSNPATASISVTPPENPSLQVSPTSLDFGVMNPSQQKTMNIEIRNAGTGTLTWSVSDNRGWISASPSSGSITTETVTVTVTVNTAGLSSGSYSGTVSVSSNGGAINIPVTVQIAPQPVNHPPQISGIPDRTIEVGSTIQPIDLWQYASDTEDSPLQMAYSIVSQSRTDIINCYIDSNRYLECGSAFSEGYTDIRVKVTDTGNPTGEPKSDTDTFRITVTAPPENPSLQVSPTSLDFGVMNPSQQKTMNIEIRNAGTGTLTWSVSDNRGWISASPSSGSITTETVTVTVTVNTAGLSSGSYSGTVSVSSNGGAINIPVTVQIAPQPVNHPPQISGIPDRTIEVGSTIQPIDLWQYADDAEDADYEMDYSIISESDANVIDCYIDSNRYIKCGNANMAGTSTIRVKVTDTGNPTGERKSDTDAFVITAYERERPALSVNPLYLDFGTVMKGKKETMNIYIENAGTGTLYWRAETPYSWISVSPSSGSTTTETDEAAITVKTSSLEEGVYYGEVIVKAEESEISVLVSVSVKEPPGFDPVVESVLISPSKPVVGETLKCLGEFSDADGNLESAAFMWYVNENLASISVKSISGYSATSSDYLETDGFSEGDEIRCEAYAYDTKGNEDMKFAIVAFKGPENPPYIKSIEITPQNPSENDDVVCLATAEDIDGDLDYMVFEWVKGSSVIYSETKSADGYEESASSKLSASLTSGGDVIKCRVSAYDKKGNSDSWSVVFKVSSVEPPEEMHAPLISGTTITPVTAHPDSRLECSATVSDADGDLFIASMSWKINNAEAFSETKYMSGYESSISSALPESVQLEAGDEVRCDITALDLAGNENYAFFVRTISPKPPSSNTPPSVSVSVSPKQPASSDDITCSADATDADGNLESIVFEWRIPAKLGNNPIRTTEKGASGSSSGKTDTLPSSFTDEGDIVICTAYAKDSAGEVVSASDAAVVMASPDSNDAPIANLNAYPTHIYEGNTVTFDASLSYDTDGEVVAYYFDFGDGSSSGWVPADRAYHSYSSAGTYYAKLRVKDNRGAESAWSSAVRITVNAQQCINCGANVPVIENAYITPSSPSANDDITCNVVATDEDGDLKKITFNWAVNGVIRRAKTYYKAGSFASASDVLPSSKTSPGDSVRCFVTVYDESSFTDTATAFAAVKEDATASYTPPSGICGVSIKNVRYPDKGYENRLAWIEADVVNTGTKSEEIEIKAVVEGKIKGIFR